MLSHFLRLFLAHGATQEISTTQRIARHHLSNLHDLLLIQNDAVSGLKNGFETFVLVLGVWEGNGLPPVFTVNKIFNHAGLKRSGTKEGHQRNDVLKTIRLQILDQLFHPAALELKYRRGIARLKQPEHVGVIERKLVNVKLTFALRIDHCDGPLNDGQRPEPEKVKLHQPSFLDVVLVVVGDDTTTILVAVDGRKVSQFGRSNDHATRVLARVTGHAL